MNQVIQNF